MPIPPPAGIPLGLTSASPSVITPQTLATQLEDVGLSCSEITPQTLQQYIDEVNSQLPMGDTESYAISAPAGTITQDRLPAGVELDPAALQRSYDPPAGTIYGAMPPNVTAGIGNWTENDAAEGWSANLEVIQFPAHFDWLMSQRDTNGFDGTVDNPPAYTGYYANAEAIQKLFINVAVNASSVVVQGIDQTTMSAVFSNVIQPLADANLSNYDQTGSRVIMLVENYNTSTGAADAIGVVAVDWRLQITDYKRKSKDGGDTHWTVLTISSRAATYSDVVLLCTHYFAVLAQFGINPTTAPTCRRV